ETEISFADGQELLAAPAAERVVGIERTAFAVPTLRVHQHAIRGERIALPFEPEALRPALLIRAVPALQHQAFDAERRFGAEAREALPILRCDQRRKIQPVALPRAHERL